MSFLLLLEPFQSLLSLLQRLLILFILTPNMMASHLTLAEQQKLFWVRSSTCRQDMYGNIQNSGYKNAKKAAEFFKSSLACIIHH